MLVVVVVVVVAVMIVTMLIVCTTTRLLLLLLLVGSLNECVFSSDIKCEEAGVEALRHLVDKSGEVSRLFSRRR